MTVRDLLLATQIAICAVLVTASLVGVRGLARSLGSKLGLDPHHAMLVETDPSEAGYTGDAIPAMQKRIIEALQAIPGVTSVGLVGQYPPLHLGGLDSKVFTGQASDLRPSNAVADAIMYSASPNYFQAARTALLSGRVFTWRDDKNAPRVAVVNREFARRVFGSMTNAIGGYYKMPDGTRIQVVGIVENGKYTANIAEEPQPAMFSPSCNHPRMESGWWCARISRRSNSAPPLGLPSFIQTWDNEMNAALFASRMATISLGVLGAMGALLSITGIFGLAAYTVSKRKRELGIRIALGAQRNEVLQAALGRAFKLLAFGSAAGLILGLLASRVLALIVYQANPRDPLVLAGAVLAMSSLGLLATWIPARRALAIEPSILMREE